MFNFLEGENDSCISFVRSCSVTIVSIQEVRGWDVMVNIVFILFEMEWGLCLVFYERKAV